MSSDHFVASVPSFVYVAERIDEVVVTNVAPPTTDGVIMIDSPNDRLIIPRVCEGVTIDVTDLRIRVVNHKLLDVFCVLQGPGEWLTFGIVFFDLCDGKIPLRTAQQWPRKDST